MTEALARRCAHAIHVLTPEGVVLSAGRASLYLMDAVGWRRFSAVFSTRPLIWLVEAAYRVVAGRRQWFSRFLFRPERLENQVGDDVRLERLKLALCLALAAGLLLSQKLWVSSRTYPLMPVWAHSPTIPFPLDYVVFVVLLLLLGAAAAARRPLRPLAAILIIAGGLSMLDQSRWQPWFYQYVFMLGALALHYWKREPAAPAAVALNTCRVIVASVYLWSGLHKLNRSFVNGVFPWFLQGLFTIPAGMVEYLAWLGAGVALLEVGIGIGLITTRWRFTAIIAAIPMHLFILVCLGPLGHNIDRGVWPWNLAMIAFNFLLFRNTALLPARQILSPANGWYHVAVLVLFAILPALSFVQLWDSYLSFTLFSGDTKRAQIYVSDGVRRGLPSAVRVYVTQDESGRNVLDYGVWSMEEMKVPSYPEARIYRRLALYPCRYAKAPGEVELVIAQRSLAAVLRSLMRLRLEPTLRSISHYDCGSLRP